jgi:hypothetical protein
MEVPMRAATLSLTLALLCTLTIPASAQPKGPKNNGQNTRAPWGRSSVSRADWLLAKRLASIDHLRSIAQKNGNTRLLEQTDKLEAIARRQHIIHQSSGSSGEPIPESP